MSNANLKSYHHKQTIPVPSMGKLNFSEVKVPENMFILISAFKISGVGAKVNKKMKKQSYNGSGMIFIPVNGEYPLTKQLQKTYNVQLDDITEASGIINIQIDQLGNYSVFAQSNCGAVTSIDIECDLDFCIRTSNVNARLENTYNYNELFKIVCVTNPDLAPTESIEKAVQYKKLIDFIDTTIELSKNGYKRSSLGFFHSNKYKQTIFYNIMEKE